MNLILSRHGNTFGPGDRVVWTGAGHDLPLVETGIEQAHALAAALKAEGVRPAAVYCGPLQRTRVYAQIVIEDLGLELEPIVDQRLDELDYGEWTGLTNDEVVARFGDEELRAWNERCVWPSRAGWGGSQQAVIADVQSFAASILDRHRGDSDVLAVSSNGRLRYFLTLVEGEFDRRVADGTIKVRTGHMCRLVHDAAWRVIAWNERPGGG